MKDILIDAFIDAIKLVPFLFLSFIIMELIEHKFTNKKQLSKINKFGPIAGSLFGIIPQCGFSALASNLYAARVITFGFLVDLFFKKSKKDEIDKICEEDHCHCEDSILKSSLIHTIKITIFILIVNIILNYIIDTDKLTNIVQGNKILIPIITSIIGLIPNCAASVLITELYLSNVIPFGSCLAGLLSSSGVGLLVLFKQNKNILENILILLSLIIYSSICGILFNIII